MRRYSSAIVTTTTETYTHITFNVDYLNGGSLNNDFWLAWRVRTALATLPPAEADLYAPAALHVCC